MKRIQRKRTKGWKMPENTIYVGRGTKWGNPFKLVGDMIYINARYRRWSLDQWVYYSLGNIEDILNLYEEVLNGSEFSNRDARHWSDHFKGIDLSELKGKDLACWCGLDMPCHAEIILKLTSQL